MDTLVFLLYFIPRKWLNFLLPSSLCPAFECELAVGSRALLGVGAFPSSVQPLYSTFPPVLLQSPTLPPRSVEQPQGLLQGAGASSRRRVPGRLPGQDSAATQAPWLPCTPSYSHAGPSSRVWEGSICHTFKLQKHAELMNSVCLSKFL